MGAVIGNNVMLYYHRLMSILIEEVQKLETIKQ